MGRFAPAHFAQLGPRLVTNPTVHDTLGTPSTGTPVATKLSTSSTASTRSAAATRCSRARQGPSPLGPVVCRSSQRPSIPLGRHATSEPIVFETFRARGSAPRDWRVGAREPVLHRRHSPVPSVLALPQRGPSGARRVSQTQRPLRPHDGSLRRPASLRSRSGNRLRAASVGFDCSKEGHEGLAHLGK